MKRLFTTLICLLACGLYVHFFVNTAYVEVEIAVEEKADFKIYWAEANQLYSENHMAGVLATPERKQYGVFFTNIEKIARLRVDTHNYEGSAKLKKLVIRQEGWKSIVLSTPEEFSKLVPLQQIANSRIDEDGFWVQTSGQDGFFELEVHPEQQGLNLGWLILRLMAIVAIVLGVLYCVAPLVEDLRFVPALLTGVLVLIICMAALSKNRVHPDEYVHMAATTYYQDNWLPPIIEDPAIRDTFSVYGVSRLNNGEIYYFFAGKFHKFLQTFNIPEYLSLRLFNVFLFSLIILYTIRSLYARMVALPFLISSQIWYVFSYCASDAFALFFAFIAACELVDPNSLLHSYLKGTGWKTRFFGSIGLGVLLGLVFLLKQNYLPFIAFFYFVLTMKIFLTDQFFLKKKAAILRLVLITCIGSGIFGLRTGADYLVNGFDHQEKIDKKQEEMADYAYKPSTELQKKQVSLSRKARGITLEEIINVDGWFERMFQSSFGVFGYFTISGTENYYDLVRWSGALLLVFFFGAIFRGGGWIGSGLAVGALGISAGLIGITLYHCWTVDFQTQGRYLLPTIPTLGVVYGWNYTVIHRYLITLCVAPMFLLAMYSFIFDGLLQLPRVVFP